PPTPVAAPWYGSMKDGWLCDSILNATASPSPMSTTPAFSPGPWITRGPVVGNVRRCTREDLYEQCSLHIAEKIPSSTRFGSRPRISWMRADSSSERLCSRMTSSVIVTGLPLRRASSRRRERGDGRLEHADAHRVAEEGLGAAVGVRHETDHVAVAVADAGDVAGGAVRVGGV